MITIPLSKNGTKHRGKYEAIVDDCDADLADFNWVVLAPKAAYDVYAVRYPYKTVGPTVILMHRLILERKLKRPLSKTEISNHIDGNRLNNQRLNLRVATRRQIQQAKRIRKDNSSGYKGVYATPGGRWLVEIMKDGKKIGLGTFDTPEEAHAAYCEAAKEHFGEFANEG